MKLCPNCRTEAQDAARYCRSCYTVFQDADAQDDAVRHQRAKWLAYVVPTLAVVGLATVAWFNRVDLHLVSDTQQAEDAVSADTGGNETITSAVRDKVAADAQTEPRKAWGRSTNSIAAASVDRRGGNCAINQAVQNSGRTIMYPVTLEFSYENALGKRIGPSVRGVIETILPPDERRGFTFHMQCPQTFARVGIHTVDPQARIGGDGSVDDVAGLIAGPPVIDPLKLHLAIRVPDNFIMCRTLSPCQLMLRFNDSWIAAWFRRDPAHPDTLIASDPQLVGQLQQGWNAEIRLPLVNGVEKLTVTGEELHEPDSAGKWNAFKRAIREWVGTAERSS